MTKSSTTKLTQSVGHTAEAPTFMTVGGKPLQNARKGKRTPIIKKAPSGQAPPRLTGRERPSEPLPHPGSFKSPEGMSYLGLDRTFKANLARVTQVFRHQQVSRVLILIGGHT